MGNEVTESEFRRHVIRCGVPKKYATKDASLRLKSKIGEKLFSFLSSKDSRKLQFKDYKILNLYSSDSSEADDYIGLCIRQILLSSTPAVCVDSYDLVRVPDSEEEEDSLLYQAQYLGLTNFDFMGSESWPLDNNSFWLLRDHITKHLKAGRVIITASNTPIKAIKCYPSSFINYLVKNAKDVNLDAGH